MEITEAHAYSASSTEGEPSLLRAGVAELVDAADSKSASVRQNAGSSPATRTNNVTISVARAFATEPIATVHLSDNSGVGRICGMAGLDRYCEGCRDTSK